MADTTPSKISTVVVNGSEYTINASYLDGHEFSDFVTTTDLNNEIVGTKAFINYLTINDDNNAYSGLDNFSGTDIDTDYYSKGITVRDAEVETTVYTLSFPAKSGTFATTDDTCTIVDLTGGL